MAMAMQLTLSPRTLPKKQIQRAAYDIINEELIVIHTLPSAQDAGHAQAILDNTVLRRQGMIRGRIDDGSASDFPAKHGAKRCQERCNKLMEMANGDWSIPHCFHHERGWCNDGGREFFKGDLRR